MVHSELHRGVDALDRLRGARVGFDRAMREVDQAATVVTRAQRLFVHTCGALLDDPDISLRDRFETPEDYYATLAGLWGDGHKQREQPGMTAEVADVVGALHAPGTIAFLMTRPTNGIPGEGERFAAGRITDGTHPRLVQGHSYTGEKTLVLSVPVGQVDGSTATSEVSMCGISARRNRLVTPGWSSPIVAVGQAAVATEVSKVYTTLSQGRQTRRSHGYEDGVLLALCKSGLKLSELGIEQPKLDKLRDQLLLDLGRACMGAGPYRNEILGLVPLYSTNEEALEAVENVAARSKVPLNSNYFLARDYGYLRAAQPPKG